MPTLRECMDRTILPHLHPEVVRPEAEIDRQEREWQESTGTWIEHMLGQHTSLGSPTCPACIRERGWHR